MDFSKAFDNVPRDKLWARLHTIGVRVRFFNAIKSTYEKVQCAVRTPNGLTNYFTSSTGVKQGCPLSPLLFGLYVDKLEVMLMRDKASKPTLEDTAIPFLGYVDDLVILSLDEEGMQRCLRTLKFCKETELEVNLEKTKIMHFGKKRKILEAPKLKFKGAQVEIVKQYTWEFHLEERGEIFWAKPKLRLQKREREQAWRSNEDVPNSALGIHISSFNFSTPW